jgi:hypothetical protein
MKRSAGQGCCSNLQDIISYTFLITFVATLFIIGSSNVLLRLRVCAALFIAQMTPTVTMLSSNFIQRRLLLQLCLR